MLGEEAAVFMNAEETFVIYDTIQIREQLSKQETLYGFQSYAAMAQKSKIPFFNVRNVGEVGLAYTNLETKDQMPYVFQCSSIGVQFAAPLALFEPFFGGEGAPIVGGYNAASHAIFIQEIPYHVGLRFKVQQDEKLLSTCYLTPSGTGPHGLAGVGGSTIGNVGFAGVTSMSQGQPFLGNRFNWPEKLSIPRGATFSAELELSDYGRALLAQLKGPTQYKFSNDGVTEEGVPACATVRISLFGTRQVQQRSQLHR